MLLIYQTGSVKIGEIVRYTVTYTPAYDRILPAPPNLFLRIKNTCPIALRAAFVHGPYTLYASAYPATFDPNSKFESPRTYGVPEYEPNLKAGGTFHTKLTVPEDVRQMAGNADKDGRNRGETEDVKSISWIIEVSSQVIFSTSAAVHYEILVGRDEKSLSLGFPNSLTGGGAVPAPGQVSDHLPSQGAKDGHHNVKPKPKGIYSKAVKLRVDDTPSLWNTPRMPEWPKDSASDDVKDVPTNTAADLKESQEETHTQKKQKKVHLVVLTHGLHANLGADMLYMKESIDATSQQARIDARGRRAKRREEAKTDGGNEDRQSGPGLNKSTSGKLEEGIDEDEDEEQVIVRGFSGNATRTERGIKYLGKRLAKYVLAMTYPDQPYRPITKKTAAEAISRAVKPSAANPAGQAGKGQATHSHSTIHKDPVPDHKPAYKITSISFIAHSLGGLIQTYAVAYIQKHSPEFFDIIKPINFIAMATPFLGLSNENPLYVKFALNFGLVGRTGQDLGLTWRTPTIARSGWGAIVGGIGENAHKKVEGESPPESKPLLRILPTGPAHTVLKRFRNRTVYSNVVNDGIVPLRTSCLLFLDWQGLGRVEKARRENGLVGTMANWGWAEITGQNTVSPMARTFSEAYDSSDNGNVSGGENTPTQLGHGDEVPQPSPYATLDDNRSIKSYTRNRSGSVRSTNSEGDIPQAQATTDGPFTNFVKLFQPNPSPKNSIKSTNQAPKQNKIYKRSQTLGINSDDPATTISKQSHSPQKTCGKATANHSDDEGHVRMSAPPKTTFFEAAGDLLNPPLAPVEFLIDPKTRPRTIFHDRVYHPSDIPAPPLKKRPIGSLLSRRSTSNMNATSPSSTTSSASSVPPIVPRAPSNLSTGSSTQDYDDTKNTNPDKDPRDVVDGSAMKVEEKIARAYHRDLSWRKVLVSLEPDAHNNMIVRRMFANAYGWPVVKHMCDTHFSDAAVANTRDENESNEERAKAANETPNDQGKDIKDDDGQIRLLEPQARSNSEAREATDNVPELNPSPNPKSLAKALSKAGINSERSGNESEGWSERDWVDSAEDSDDFEEAMHPPSQAQQQKDRRGSGDVEKKGWNWTEAIAGRGATSPRGTAPREIDNFLGKKGKGKATVAESEAAVAQVARAEVAKMGVGLE